MRFFALFTIFGMISFPALAEEWKIMMQEVFAFPIQCPQGEYSTPAAKIIKVEGIDITLRPDSICVKVGSYLQ